MSALRLRVLLSPASVPGAGLEHMYPCRPAGAQVFTGTPTGAGGGLGGGQRLAHLDPRGQRRLCRGRPQTWDPRSRQRLWPGPLRSATHAAGRGLVLGAQAQDSCSWNRPWLGGGIQAQELCHQERPWRGQGFRPGVPAGSWGPEGLGEVLAALPSSPLIP